MLVNFLPYLIPASDLSYGGGQTEPGPGLPGGPGPVSRPGPGREGASLGVARRAPEIGKKMGEAGRPERGTGSVEDGGVLGVLNVVCLDRVLSFYLFDDGQVK